jgi:hypothetical protein
MSARSLRTLCARLDCVLQSDEGSASEADGGVLPTVDVPRNFNCDRYAMLLDEIKDTILVRLECKNGSNTHVEDLFMPWQLYDPRANKSVPTQQVFKLYEFVYIYMVFNAQSAYLLLMCDSPLVVMKAPWEKTERVYNGEVVPLRKYGMPEFVEEREACDNETFLRTKPFKRGRQVHGKFNEIGYSRITHSHIELEFPYYTEKPPGKFVVTFLLPTPTSNRLDPPPSS